MFSSVYVAADQWRTKKELAENEDEKYGEYGWRDDDKERRGTDDIPYGDTANPRVSNVVP